MKQRPLAHSTHFAEMILLFYLFWFFLFWLFIDIASCQLIRTERMHAERNTNGAVQTQAETQNPCRKIAPGRYDCTDQDLIDRLAI